ELARLPDRFRAPLVLCYLEGLTRDEAARRLGWPASVLESRLEQARERLRRRLEARGVALVAALFADAAGAAVPPALAAATAQAAAAVAAGAAAVVPKNILTLSEGACHAMSPTKLHVVVALLIGCGL